MVNISGERQRALAQFDEQSRRARRQFGMLLLPLLAFGLFIFLPFAEQAGRLEELEEDLDSLNMQLAPKRDSLLRSSPAGGLAVDRVLAKHGKSICAASA